MSPKQDGFNWVEVRAECSLAVEFERLKAAVQGDVAARNKLGDNVHCELQSREKNGMFYVTASCNPKDSRAVYFMLKPSHILVEDNVENEMFRATITVSVYR